VAENSKITWTDHTWNWSHGCPGCPDSLELGCKNCYMRIWAKRAGIKNSYEVTKSSKDTFNMPLKSRRKVPGDMIFTLSLGDFFHPLNDPYRPEVWDIMRRTPDYTYQVLTKFPENIVDRLPADWSNGWSNVWLGVTAENQEMANKRIPILLSIPAAIRFVSIEPMLGPVDLTFNLQFEHPDNEGYGVEIIKGLDWVIVGGESGSHARPMHPDWIRQIRDQCQASGTPFFFKQWGAWITSYDSGFRSEEKSQYNRTIGECWVKNDYRFNDGQVMVRVGAKTAGDILDNKQYHEFPIPPCKP